MHVAITGAAGFVGAGLVRRLLAAPQIGGRGIERLSLIDRQFTAAAAAPWVHRVEGDFGDAGLWARLGDVDLVFHLASVPGALAEREPALGDRVNLQATLALAQRLADQAQRSGKAPRCVFASSIAVYGALGPQDAHEDALPQPALRYGTHKLMAEIALADLSRRGEIDAWSLRLPGIVARPPADSGHGSAFMSLLFHRLAAAEPYVCPVSPAATAWWMSLPCCIDNLLHAAALPADLSATRPLPSRVWQLPVLQVSVGALIGALVQHHGADRAGCVSHHRDERIEALFGRLPPLHTPRALAAGFRHDGDLATLIRNATATPPAVS